MNRKELMSKVQSTFQQAIFDDFVLKVVSISLAVGIWAWLQSGQVVEQRARATVRYLWPEGLVRVGEAPDSLSVTLTGPQGRLRALQGRELLVDVDLRASKEGPVTVDFGDRPLEGLPEGVSVVQRTPASLDLLLDRARERKVRIRPTLIGEPAEGWQRGEVRVEPATTVIRGPQSLVREITEADTDIIDLSGVTATRTYTVPLDFRDSSVRADALSQVQVTVEVTPIIGDRTWEAVPVTLAARGWQVSPETVRLRIVGPIKRLQSIRTEDLQVSVRLPPAVPVGEPVKVRWAAGERDGLVQIQTGVRDDDLTITLVEPAQLELRPAP